MKPETGNSLPDQTDWKRFLESAEILQKKTSLQEQSAFFTKSIAEIFQLKAHFWFAEPLFPLPGEDTPELVGSQSNPYPLVSQTYANRQPCFRQFSRNVVDTFSKNEEYLEASLPVYSDKDLLGILLIESSEGQP
ncbi:MAG TPA: hypothetical protein VF338_11125, partial [Leptolinea sp.]